MNIGIEIKKQREAQGLTIYALSKKSGIPWSTIKSYENGISPTVEKADALLKSLGISMQIGATK